MFGGLVAWANASPEERAARGADMMRYMTPPGQEVIPVEDQCVNCTQRAMESGWCSECSAGLFPPGWDARG